MKAVAKQLARIVQLAYGGVCSLGMDVVKLWGLWVMITAIGFALLTMRAIVLWAAPSFVHHAKTWSIAFDALCDMVIILEEVVADTIEAVKTVVKFFQGKHYKAKWTTLGDNLVEIDATGLHDFFNHLIYTCGPYNTVESIAYPTMLRITSPILCPIIRYTYPVPFMFTAADTVLGWASYDAAPTHFGKNCEPSQSEVIEAECVILGSGYLVLEILLPAVVSALVLFRLGKPVLLVFVLAIQLAGQALVDGALQLMNWM